MAPLVGAVLAALVFRGFAQGGPVPAAVVDDDDDLDAEDGPGAADSPGAADGPEVGKPARTPGGNEARDFFDGKRGH